MVDNYQNVFLGGLSTWSPHLTSFPPTTADVTNIQANLGFIEPQSEQQLH